MQWEWRKDKKGDQGRAAAAGEGAVGPEFGDAIDGGGVAPAAPIAVMWSGTAGRGRAGRPGKQASMTE